MHWVDKVSVVLYQCAVEKLDVALKMIGWPDPIPTLQEWTEKVRREREREREREKFRLWCDGFLGCVCVCVGDGAA